MFPFYYDQRYGHQMKAEREIKEGLKEEKRGRRNENKKRTKKTRKRTRKNKNW